jgi:hypothetical protein
LDQWQYQYLDTVVELLTGSKKELQKLDRKTRKLLTIHGEHHPKADVDRSYVPKKQGERCPMQLEEPWTVDITKLVKYVDRKFRSTNRLSERTNTNVKSAVLQTARRHKI